MGEADEGGLHGFRGRAAGPRFLLVQFVFDFIIGFLNIPPHLVESCDHSRWNRPLIGQKIEDFPAARAAIPDVADHDPADPHLAVKEDSGIDRILRLKRKVAAFDDAGVAFHSCQKIDAVPFELAPEEVVDAGGIVNVEALAAFGGSLTPLLYREALEGAHFVLLAARDLVSHGEMGQTMGAQIEGVEVAGGEFGIPGPAGLAGLREVMRGGGMGVTVRSVQIEAVKATVGGKGIGNGGAEGDAKGHIGFLAESKAAFALEKQEESADGRQTQLGLHGLEEIASAFDSFHDAANAQLNPIGIGHFWTNPPAGERAEQRKEGPEEMGVERGGWVYGNSHKKQIFSCW